ncbi:TonB-dependent receptor [Tannerella forsythia]|uniref:TonB-dependent receptor n=1 Tax=Tannerella forsythia TaxID=28112 RepID=A0A3P1Z2B9_TANFO|nr:TonB-dependent receptor [Tannerella forsythia]RRD76256.1 TonB-dependent receptor [Tannerella forsythia]
MKKFYLLWWVSCMCLTTAKVHAEKGKILPDTLKTYNIDEVVITSSAKETNSLRTLPGAVSILTPQQIKGRQMTSIKDIRSFVPNLYLPDYGAKLTSAIYIRGVGARSSGQSVGLYVDNAPYPDKSTFDFELPDVQRIEVLRGAQGTLYGRNAMGGIINIHTLSPLDYQGTKLSLAYGNYGRFRAKASHYMKITHSFGLSAGAYYSRRDGFFKNEYTGKKADAEKTTGGHLKLHWQITPGIKALYSLSGEYSDQGAFPYGLYDLTTGKVAQVKMNDPSSYRRTMLHQSLSLTYETKKILLSSTTGYQYFDDDMKMDQDFSAASVFVLNQLQKQHAFSQEVSVKSRTEKNYQWSVGAYGFYTDMRTEAPVELKEDGIKRNLQPIFDRLKAINPKMPSLVITDKSIGIPSTFETPSYGAALYHQSTYKNLFIKGLSLTAGVRLDYEKQDLRYNAKGKMHLTMQLPPKMPEPKDISSLYPASVIDESISSDLWQVLPKISIKYECSPRTVTYLSASKGYKTGGYNMQMSADIMQARMQYDMMNVFSTFMPSIPKIEPEAVKDVISYRPETSWNYEIGVKSELIRDHLHAELTFFYLDIANLQITKFVTSGHGRILSNAGKAESYGAELSLRAILTNDLTADLNYGYTHATFRDYHDGRTDFSGRYIPYTPRHTLGVGLHYTKSLKHCWINQFFASAQCNGAGPIYWTEHNDLLQKFYATIHTQAGVRKGIFSLDLWIKNLTDTDYSAFYFKSFDKSFMQKGSPLQFGTKLNITF